MIRFAAFLSWYFKKQAKPCLSWKLFKLSVSEVAALFQWMPQLTSSNGKKLPDHMVKLPFENGPHYIFGIKFTQNVSGGEFDALW
jgi:hypothetical protein